MRRLQLGQAATARLLGRLADDALPTLDLGRADRCGIVDDAALRDDRHEDADAQLGALLQHPLEALTTQERDVESQLKARLSGGQLAANHFATVEPDDGWQDRLREVGRRCLWQGAQPIRITESG